MDQPVPITRRLALTFVTNAGTAFSLYVPVDDTKTLQELAKIHVESAQQHGFGFYGPGARLIAVGTSHLPETITTYSEMDYKPKSKPVVTIHLASDGHHLYSEGPLDVDVVYEHHRPGELASDGKTPLDQREAIFREPSSEDAAKIREMIGNSPRGKLQVKVR